MESKRVLSLWLNSAITRFTISLWHIGNGYYMYTEASGLNPGRTSLLRYTLPRIALGSTICVQFYYHMYSNSLNGMGTLNIKLLSSRGTASFISTISGNQGNAWKVHRTLLRTTDSQHTVSDNESGVNLGISKIESVI